MKQLIQKRITEYGNIKKKTSGLQIHLKSGPFATQPLPLRISDSHCKIYANNNQSHDWIDLNVQQNFTNRNRHVEMFDNSHIRVENSNNLVNGP